MAIPTHPEPSQTQEVYRPGLTFASFPQRKAGPSPRLLKLLGLPLLAALLVVPLFGWLRPPTSLSEAALTGARGPGCLRLVLASDHHGRHCDIRVGQVSVCHQAAARMLRAAQDALVRAKAEEEIVAARKRLADSEK